MLVTLDNWIVGGFGNWKLPLELLDLDIFSRFWRSKLKLKVKVKVKVEVKLVVKVNGQVCLPCLIPIRLLVLIIDILFLYQNPLHATHLYVKMPVFAVFEVFFLVLIPHVFRFHLYRFNEEFFPSFSSHSMLFSL